MDLSEKILEVCLVTVMVCCTSGVVLATILLFGKVFA